MGKNIITYGKQFIDKKDILEVSKSLQRDLITTGSYVTRFENRLKSFFKSKFVYSCSNATSGLHLAFKAINLKKNDVVIMPAINFISSYRMAKMLGAKIFLIDVDRKNGQVTKESILRCIKENRIKKVKAIVSMYLGGYVENNIEIFELKKKLGCYLIEDACHALGASYTFKNKIYKIGSCSHSDICVFSFHPVKSLTTGEGGAIATNDINIAKKLVILRNHGIIKSKNYWDYDIKNLGFNYRLSDINCSLGVSQLTKLKLFFKKRKDIYNIYIKNLSKYNDLVILPKVKNKNNFYHLFLLGINFNKIKGTKDDLFKFLNKKKIFPQYHYKPIYKFYFFKGKVNKKFLGAEEYHKNF